MIGMKQTDLMMQSKATLTGVAALSLMTACTFEQPTYFDESELLTDSVVMTDADGQELSRTTFHHDEAGRDTLVVTLRGGQQMLMRTTYNPDGEKASETLSTSDYTIATTYTKLNDTLTIAQMTATTANGIEAEETTELTQDSAGRTTQSLTTTADGKQKKISTRRNALGQETEVTTWMRDIATAEWDPVSRLTYEYADSLVQRAAYATWEDGTWTELSYETYTYDGTGHLIKKEERADDVCVATTYTYDSASNKTRQETCRTDGDGARSTVAGELNWKYGELRKTETEYSVVETYDGKSQLEETRTVTYYSPKTQTPQMPAQRH